MNKGDFMNTIVAVDNNWGIGKDGKLLVTLPGDLRYFKNKTLGKTVIMGRKTLNSLPNGKPLPSRHNIILTREKNFEEEDCMVFNYISDIIEYVKKIDTIKDSKFVYQDEGKSYGYIVLSDDYKIEFNNFQTFFHK